MDQPTPGSEAVFLFIHLGDKPPPYLAANLARTTQLFPLHEIAVVVNSRDAKAELRKTGSQLYEVSDFLGTAQQETNSQTDRVGFDHEFWDGYWQKTFERLLLLDSWNKAFGRDRPLFHVESDVILLPNFPVKSLASLEKCSWPGHNETADIASIVVLPNLDASSIFQERLVETSTLFPSATDMEVLFKMRTMWPESFCNLPNMHSKEGVGGMAFDGLQFGDWLAGWDPKAHWGFRRRRFRSSVFSDAVSAGTFHLDEIGRLWFTNSEGLVVGVANLHVHSKEMKFFDYPNTTWLERVIGEVKSDRTFWGFDSRAFFSWLRSRISRWSSSVLRPDRWFELLRRS